MASRFQVVKWLKEPSVFVQTSSSCANISTKALRRTIPCFPSSEINGQRRTFLTSCCCAASQDTTPHVSLTGPSVRNLLEWYHLESVPIEPSGGKGQLLKGDVLKYIKENEKVPEMFTSQATTVDVPFRSFVKTATNDIGYTDHKLTSITGETVNTQMVTKTTTPHIYTTIECNMDKILAMQKRLERDGIYVTANDFIIKATGLCLGRVPELNSYWSEDGRAVLHDAINIAVAVSSPHGLKTPVINAVNELDIKTLSTTLKELSQRAKEEQLKVQELQGGSFTVSNLGMFGIKHFTAVLYPQQTGVLAVGEPWVSVNENGYATTVMTVTLSCDGRVVDESNASTWLGEFQKIIENPLQMAL